ncbi:hypothetical protein AVEN_115710-1 [Araneus ventricosus]|uniref:Uncharacterized protein n=1 Tax=Araneus ventricosus TaxID=182803 RepID=A0A4Y2GNW4_ARAVE|nr:hypothetical protein AVEN_7138-1 [Araneus ventricosus]GBM54455.1 hypothetical protein AVEN_115710-1 [Araneus ventricosus]
MPISYLFLPHPPSCRKFHSSPRPSVFCLSIGYFLSDSEALALPKCRTFIYAMEPTERKRVLLTVEQSFQIVSRIEAEINFIPSLKAGRVRPFHVAQTRLLQAQTYRQCEKQVRIGAELLDIQPVQINTIPFGLPSHKSTLTGVATCTYVWEGFKKLGMCSSLRKSEKTEIEMTDSGWMCVAWSGRE